MALEGLYMVAEIRAEGLCRACSGFRDLGLVLREYTGFRV